MPELPEVETTLLAIAHKIKHLHIQSVHVYQPSLRLKVPDDLHDRCKTQKVLSMVRRAKYLIIHLNSGHILIHLGMSGHLRLLSADQAPKNMTMWTLFLMKMSCLDIMTHAALG